MLRVVIDTSTLVSFALTAGDITRQLIDGWRGEEFTLLTTPATRAELRRVLEKPRIVARSKRPLTWLADDIDLFSVHVAGNRVVQACRDPKDDKFLACAVEGDAHYLVSSDLDLLVMRQFKSVCILNPGEFLIVLQLTRLTAAEIARLYSAEALTIGLNTLCLDAELTQKVKDALTQTG
jgi:putative PIN family toxin of toxin-antitoxin system